MNIKLKIERYFSNVEFISFDLWIIAVLMLLSPKYIIPNAAYSGTPIVLSTLMFLLSIIYIILFAWLLKRCGVLIKYRYIFLKLDCPREPNNIMKHLYLIIVALIACGIYCVFNNWFNILDYTNLFVYMVFVMLLNMSLSARPQR